jgi:DNA-binding transcriptional regulator YiaG
MKHGEHNSDARPEAIEDLRVIEALDRLEAESLECGQIARLRHCSGLSIEQVATLLELEPHIVRRRWNLARAWMVRALEATE